MTKVSIVEQINGFSLDPAMSGRIQVDFNDLAEACDWFLFELRKERNEPLTKDEMETFLIDIQTKFVEHAQWHMKSLYSDLEAILATFPDEDGKIERATSVQKS